jgi:hypothetical protein
MAFAIFFIKLRNSGLIGLRGYKYDYIYMFQPRELTAPSSAADAIIPVKL